MSQVVINAEKRDLIKKNASFKLRQEGKIPAVVYGNGIESLSLSLNGKEIIAIINNKEVKNAIIDLSVEGISDVKKVILKDFQTDPVNNRLLHVDFYEFSANKEMTVTIPIKLIGKAKGLAFGGILEQIMRDVEIKCLPVNIPKEIEVDITDLDVGDNLHLNKVTFPEGITPVTELRRTVAVITEPENEEKAVSAEEEEVEEEVISEEKK